MLCYAHRKPCAVWVAELEGESRSSADRLSHCQITVAKAKALLRAGYVEQVRLCAFLFVRTNSAFATLDFSLYTVAPLPPSEFNDI